MTKIPTYNDLISSGARPRVHGNGFLQLDLNPEGTKRLHIWSAAMPRQAVNSSIHDHTFSILSTVICGTLIHKEFSWRNIRSYLEGDYKVYQAEQVKESNNTVLKWNGDFVRLSPYKTLTLGPGSSYVFAAGEFHDTDHIGLTATIMEKIKPPVDYGRPRVLVPVGTEPDNEFDREGFDPDILWPFVKEALTLASWMAKE